MFIYVFRIILGAVLILLLSFLLINQFDESLAPNVQTLRNNLPQPIPEPNNAFYALVGLHADNGDDFHASGFLASQQSSKKPQQPLQIVDLTNYKSEFGYIDFVSDETVCNYASQQKCFASHQQDPARLSKHLQQNARLLSRYEQILSYPQFYEAVVSFESPWANDLIALNHLYLNHLGQQVLQGNIEPALIKLNTSLAFWQRIMASHVSLLGKMIAISNVKYHYYLISELAEQKALTGQHRQQLHALLRPLSKQELSTCSSFEKEFLITSQLLNIDNMVETGHMKENSGTILMSLGFQPNATINYLYRVYQPILVACQAPITRIKDSVEVIRRNSEEIQDIFDPFSLFYNPTGKIMTAIAIPSFDHYLVTPYELESLRRLVKVKVLIADNHVNSDSIPEYIISLSSDYMNPFTGNFVEYDKNNNQLIIRHIINDEQTVKVSL